ncbi:MAG TPA: HipA family kinase [Capillimicrobium sp.]|nr:HipA family kinase [Capillimicrobium sp.]
MPVTTELRDVAATRYVTPLREGGSMPGLVEADDDGLYVLKFRGAGQGGRALAAEVIAGELARALGLPVPELVLADVDPALGRAEPDPEIQELIESSPGTNLGVDFLPGALPYSPAVGWKPEPELAADVVWLDAFTTNVDRTPQNPNLLVWHERLWLIDHGAALYLQHAGLRPAEHAERPFPQIADHVLLPCAGPIPEADERLAPRVDRALIAAAVALVPEAWLDGTDPETYVEYLARRAEGARGFVEEAERARRRS